jgi:hypothetical protein
LHEVASPLGQPTPHVPPSLHGTTSPGTRRGPTVEAAPRRRPAPRPATSSRAPPCGAHAAPSLNVQSPSTACSKKRAGRRRPAERIQDAGTAPGSLKPETLNLQAFAPTLLQRAHLNPVTRELPRTDPTRTTAERLRTIHVHSARAACMQSRMKKSHP